MSQSCNETNNADLKSHPNEEPKHDQSKASLESWLNKIIKVEITDGRLLIGTFLCTDRDMNIIIGSCLEYVKEDKDSNDEPQEPRSIGLVMIPGRHVVSIHVDVPLNT